MRRIEQAVLNRVLRRVTSRACPSTVARSGRDGEAVDCFNVTIFKGDEPDLVLLQIIEDEVRCLRYDGNRYSIEVTVPLSQIDPDALHVTHFYGLDTVEYEGTWSVALGLWLGWPCAWLLANRLWNAIAQRLFNRRSLPARGRLDLLREIFAATSGATEAVEALDLITARHGDHWAGHPSWQSYHEQVESQLELLTDAGDLRKSGMAYRPTGQGLKTLEDSEEADRRHTENFRLQFGLGVLALASALMAAAQAGLIKFPLLLDLTPSEAASAPRRTTPSTARAASVPKSAASQPATQPSVAASSGKATRAAAHSDA